MSQHYFTVKIVIANSFVMHVDVDKWSDLLTWKSIKAISIRHDQPVI